MNTSKQLFNSLFWKISGLFFLLLILLGLGYVLITSYYTNRYIHEANQRLNKDLAQYTVDHVNTFREDGTVDTLAIQAIMNSMMVINPNVEVYLLNPEGEIITYVAPYKKVKLEKVDLEPVEHFISAYDTRCIMGDDPRNPGGQKVFSAAPIEVDDQLMGYYYIILASEKQGSVTSTLYGSYLLSIGTRSFFLTLFVAMLVGLLAIWLLTQNLRNIIETVKRFKEGEYKARIDSRGQGELTVLANTFNDMAGTIEQNIDELKAVENLRRELTANVSHDLRDRKSVV